MIELRKQRVFVEVRDVNRPWLVLNAYFTTYECYMTMNFVNTVRSEEKEPHWYILYVKNN